MRGEEGNVPPAIPFEFSETDPKRSSLLYICPSSVKLFIRRSLSPQKSMFAPGGRSQGPSENGLTPLVAPLKFIELTRPPKAFGALGRLHS